MNRTFSHHCAGVGFALVAPLLLPEFYVTLLQLHRPLQPGCPGLVLLTGVGGLTSFGQAAFVGLGAYATAYLSTSVRPVALARPAGRPRAHRRGGPAAGRTDPASVRALSADRHPGLGHQPLLPVRQPAESRRVQSASATCRTSVWPAGPSIAAPTSVWQSGRWSPRRSGWSAICSTAARGGRSAPSRADGDGRGDGGEYRALEAGDLRDRRLAGRAVRLAVCAPAALRQSDAILGLPSASSTCS